MKVNPINSNKKNQPDKYRALFEQLLQLETND